MHLLMSSENQRQSDSDSSSSLSEPESRTRVGDDYQAKPPTDSKYSKNETKETLIWTPSEKLDDIQMEEYLFTAQAKYGYNIDQALAMLYWHNHKIEKALLDMTNYVPVPDEWSYEDKILFEQAFLYHGKNFNKIRTVLPDKKPSSLVNYYYMWKKTRNHKSLMDHMQNKNDFDEKEKEDDSDYGTVNATSLCCNCDEITQDLQSTPKGMLCILCYNYWKRTGVMRPEHVNNYSVSNKTINNKHYNGVNSGSSGGSAGVTSNGNGNTTDTAFFYLNNNKETKHHLKTFRKPPKGVYLNYDELIGLTQFNQNDIFERLDNTIMSLKRQVQSNKQEVSLLTNKFIDTDQLLPHKIETFSFARKTSAQLTTTTWTQREAELAIQGLNKYGKNFTAIADIIETKNEDTVRAFYEYHKQYINLDEIISNEAIVTNQDELKVKASLLMSHTNDDVKNILIANDDDSCDDVIIL